MPGSTSPIHRINTAGVLYKLLRKGDYVAIRHGRLVLQPASGLEVPAEWLKKHKDELLQGIAKLSGIPLFAYENYTTGRFGRHKSPGVCLHYLSVDLQQPAYVIFNVKLNRSRNTKHGKAGSDKKKGTFSVTRRHMFARKWVDWGLKLPPRYSAFHDYMGRLRDVLLTGGIGPSDKFCKESIKPAEIEFDTLLKLAGLKPSQTRLSANSGNSVRDRPDTPTEAELAAFDRGLNGGSALNGVANSQPTGYGQR